MDKELRQAQRQPVNDLNEIEKIYREARIEGEVAYLRFLKDFSLWQRAPKEIVDVIAQIIGLRICEAHDFEAPEVVETKLIRTIECKDPDKELALERAASKSDLDVVQVAAFDRPASLMDRPDFNLNVERWWVLNGEGPWVRQETVKNRVIKFRHKLSQIDFSLVCGFYKACSYVSPMLVAQLPLTNQQAHDLGGGSGLRPNFEYQIRNPIDFWRNLERFPFKAMSFVQAERLIQGQDLDRECLFYFGDELDESNTNIDCLREPFADEHNRRAPYYVTPDAWGIKGMVGGLPELVKPIDGHIVFCSGFWDWHWDTIRERSDFIYSRYHNPNNSRVCSARPTFEIPGLREIMLDS